MQWLQQTVHIAEPPASEPASSFASLPPEPEQQLRVLQPGARQEQQQQAQQQAQRRDSPVSRQQHRERQQRDSPPSGRQPQESTVLRQERQREAQQEAQRQQEQQQWEATLRQVDRRNWKLDQYISMSMSR